MMKTRVSLRDSDLRNGVDRAVNGDFSVFSLFSANFTGLRPYNVVHIRVLRSGRQWTSISLRADRNSENLRINSEFRVYLPDFL